MVPELSTDERRALRRKLRLAALEALHARGGRASRNEIRAHVGEHVVYTERELHAPPPEKWRAKHDTCWAYEFSWTLTNLKRDGLVINPSYRIWALAGAAAAEPEVLAAPALRGRVAELRAMPYKTFLRTPEWRETRNAALVRYGHACALDARHTEHLHVHHRDYARRGEERLQDVIVLCQGCHDVFHAHFGRPGQRVEPGPSVAPPPFVADVSTAAPPPAPRRSLLRRLLG